MNESLDEQRMKLRNKCLSLGLEPNELLSVAEVGSRYLLFYSIIDKYPGSFWGDTYPTMEALDEDLMSTYPGMIKANTWDEFGVTLVEVYDNNHHSEIVVVFNEEAK